MSRPARILAVAAAALVALSIATPVAAQQQQRIPPAPTGYVEMSDGTLIAVNVRMPDGYVPGRRYPTIFEMSGYESGSAGDRTVLGDLYEAGGFSGPLAEGSRQLTKIFYDEYVTVHAQVRGTGCSTGEFDLFSWRSALDGKEVIAWIARQPWSNGRIGYYSHSYGGITGFMIAATQPPELDAVSVSGLIDDLYRGITYPGGVSNMGFPLIWTVGIRNAYDVLGGTGQAIVTTQDRQCAENLATHRRTVANDPVVQGALGEHDNDWYRARSLVTYAEDIRVPIHITGGFQDEQTGPRFPHVFEEVQGVPKRLLMTNGDHGTSTGPADVWQDRRAWLDHWLLGEDNGFGTMKQAKTSVLTLFEMHGGHQGHGTHANARKLSTRFPLEDTQWTDYYLGPGGTLSREPPGANGGSDAYVSGSPRQSWSFQAGPTFGSQVTTPEGPDELTFRSEPVAENTAIAGPIVATLFLSSTSPDTEVFVQLIDEAPDGSRTYIQRGMLRASHRAVDPALSDWATVDKRRVMYRPYHPHTNNQLLTPGRAYELVVEVFPATHVFRPGHRIVMKVHSPPAADSYYAYARRWVGVNTLYHDASRPSRVMLPVVPLEADLGDEIPCGNLTAVRCVP